MHVRYSVLLWLRGIRIYLASCSIILLYWPAQCKVCLNASNVTHNNMGKGITRIHQELTIQPQENTRIKIKHNIGAFSVGYTLISLRNESRHDANFVVNGNTGSCHNDSLRCHKWRQT